MTIESEPVLSRSRVNLALATLFLATFVLGTAELGPVGMLNLIAADLDESQVRATVQDLTGRAARTFEQWASAHADAFR